MAIRYRDRLDDGAALLAGVEAERLDAAVAPPDDPRVARPTLVRGEAHPSRDGPRWSPSLASGQRRGGRSQRRGRGRGQPGRGEALVAGLVTVTTDRAGTRTETAIQSSSPSGRMATRPIVPSARRRTPSVRSSRSQPTSPASTVTEPSDQSEMKRCSERGFATATPCRRSVLESGESPPRRSTTVWLSCPDWAIGVIMTLHLPQAGRHQRPSAPLGAASKRDDGLPGASCQHLFPTGHPPGAVRQTQEAALIPAQA